MAQLRRGLPEIEAHDGVVLQITHNTVEEARRYGKFYRYDFPYLCDPDRAVHERYGLAMVPFSPLQVMRSTAAAAADLVMRGERTPLPIPFAMRHPGKESPQAVFVIDRPGVIRAVHRASPNADIPPATVLVKDLAATD
ncbi:MAG: redoxin domain-containing protein [Candidatus Rokubacteria bacterium]|nr:redoxin domain-containing protein [Candidatus Rokubacteria bacterium]